MATREVDRSLSPEALAEIERSLRGKLRSLSLSDFCVDRVAEDAMQKGLLDYLAKMDRGEEIANRNGFVVQAAFRRAIDDLRRESRHADGAVVEALIDGGGVSEPSTDEVAMELLEAEELRDAVGRLSSEEQQVLSLHYFHELTAEASAEKLFVSESTYLRKLKKTLKKLRRLLDGTVPEPGSDLAIEIGVVAWVALRGAEVVGSSGWLDGFVRAGEGLADRARDLVGRPGGSGGGTERFLAALSSGPGKAAACVTACLLGVGGAEIAGVGIGGGDGGRDVDRPAIEKGTRAPADDHATANRAAPRPAVSAPPDSPPTRRRSSGGSAAEGSQAVRRAERNEVKQRTHGITRAASEAPPTAVESTEFEDESSSPPEAEAASTATAEAQAKQEFGAFK